MADKADTSEADSQWLVERARQSLRENNPFEAKAWLITAKTLYPKDFGVQVKFGMWFFCFLQTYERCTLLCMCSYAFRPKIGPHNFNCI